MFALGVRISKPVETQRNAKLRQPAFGIKIKKPRGTEITEPKYEKRFHKVWLTCVHTVSLCQCVSAVCLPQSHRGPLIYKREFTTDLRYYWKLNKYETDLPFVCLHFSSKADRSLRVTPGNRVCNSFHPMQEGVLLQPGTQHFLQDFGFLEAGPGTLGLLATGAGVEASFSLFQSQSIHPA